MNKTEEGHIDENYDSYTYLENTDPIVEIDDSYEKKFKEDDKNVKIIARKRVNLLWLSVLGGS